MRRVRLRIGSLARGTDGAIYVIEDRNGTMSMIAADHDAHR